MDWGVVNVVDWTGMKWKCACFAMVCHHCGMRYVEFFPDAKQENLFIGMIHSFMLMGVTAVVLTDNMASVTKGRDCYGNVIYNHNYDSLQQALGFKTKLCKPRHPWTKGAVDYHGLHEADIAEYAAGKNILVSDFLEFVETEVDLEDLFQYPEMDIGNAV